MQLLISVVSIALSSFMFDDSSLPKRDILPGFN
jgi:hypothetical protein